MGAQRDNGEIYGRGIRYQGHSFIHTHRFRGGGPLYGAFPVAAVFMKKGAKFSNILIFLGAWSTTKIPTLMFEIASLGPYFALTRLAINIPGIIIIAHLLIKLMPKKEIERIRENSYEIL